MAKRLTKEQKLQIIMNDFKLFCRNFVKIVDNNGDTVPFILHKEQEDFINNLGKMTICLKGRQIGVSSVVLAYMLWQAVTKPNTNYLIITHHNKVSKALFSKLKFFYRNLPHKKYPELFPKVLLDNRDEFKLDNNSMISIGTAGGVDNISGVTWQMIQLSEMAKYPNDEIKEELLTTATFALAKNKDSKIIVESTGMGYDFFAELFLKSWRNKDSVWKPIFFNWLADGYNLLYKHSFDEAEAWYKANNGGRRLTYEDLDKTERELRDKYGATYRQLMYRRWEIMRGSEEKFNRELPTIPDHAFAGTSQSIFDTYKIIERLQYVKSPMETKEVYDILPDVLKPYINKNLFIYHLPKPKVRHYAGVDVASGTGRNNDYTAISVLDADGQQVASWYSNDIPVYKMAEIANSLLRFYNYAFTAVERNNVGLPFIEKLFKDHGFQNLLKEKIFDQRGKRKMQRGFTTTRITKPIIIEDLKQAFELGYINIECVRTLEEMKIFQEDSKGKMGNKKGNNYHDDMVMSMALCVQAMKQSKYYVDI